MRELIFSRKVTSFEEVKLEIQDFRNVYLEAKNSEHCPVYFAQFKTAAGFASISVDGDYYVIRQSQREMLSDRLNIEAFAKLHNCSSLKIISKATFIQATGLLFTLAKQLSEPCHEAPKTTGDRPTGRPLLTC